MEDERLARELHDQFLLEGTRASSAESPQEVEELPQQQQPSTSNSVVESDSAVDDEFAISQYAADDAYARMLQQQYYDEVVTSSSRYGSAGISVSKISILPTSIYRRPSFSGKIDDRECQVCRLAFEEGDTIRTLPCFHFYHVNCIDSWLVHKAVCPVCQTRVDQISEQ